MPLATDDRVPVEPLAEAFRRSRMEAADVARELGWFKVEAKTQRRRPDGNRVMQALGLVSYNRGGGRGRGTREHVSREQATKLARAIGAWPVDVGL